MLLNASGNIAKTHSSNLVHAEFWILVTASDDQAATVSRVPMAMLIAIRIPLIYQHTTQALLLATL